MTAAFSRRGWIPAVAGLSLASLWAGVSAGTIGFDLERLDGTGLYGPPDGRRALDYEFCIPDRSSAREQVASVDPSARFYPGSRGRIGCGPGQILVLGSTHGPNYREVLRELEKLPFVGPIVEAVFE